MSAFDRISDSTTLLLRQQMTQSSEQKQKKIPIYGKKTATPVVMAIESMLIALPQVTLLNPQQN
jgi:hypothetical protein